jgi:hypothetical protein
VRGCCGVCVCVCVCVSQLSRRGNWDLRERALGELGRMRCRIFGKARLLRWFFINF